MTPCATRLPCLPHGEDTARAVPRLWSTTESNVSLNEDLSTDGSLLNRSPRRKLQVFQRLDFSSAPDHVRADVPEWLAPSLERNFGSRWIEEGQGMTRARPRHARQYAQIEPRARCPEPARFSPQSSAIAPDGLRIPAGPAAARTANVQVDEGYQKGWFEIQDEGSQIVSCLRAQSRASRSSIFALELRQDPCACRCHGQFGPDFRL